MIKDPRTDVNLKDGNGWTPLMEACYDGYVPLVQLLLSVGRVDVKKKNQKGLTALLMAKEMNRTEIVSILQEYDDNPLEMQKKLRGQLNIQGIFFSSFLLLFFFFVFLFLFFLCFFISIFFSFF